MKRPSDQNTPLLKIGDAAKALKVSIDTLRRWEKKGKILSVRTPGGTRLFDVSELQPKNLAQTVSISQAAQKLGVSIKTLRRWDQTGKLQATRTDKGERSYKLGDIERVTQSVILEGGANQPRESRDSLLSLQNDRLIPSFLPKALLTGLISTILITGIITAGYLKAPQQTKSFLAASSIVSKQQSQVLGVDSDVKGLLQQSASVLLLPFDTLSKRIISSVSPGKLKELGFAPEDSNSKINAKIDQLKKDLSDKVSQVDLNTKLSTVNSQLSTVDTTMSSLIINSSFEANSSGQPLSWLYLNQSTKDNTFVNNASVRTGNLALRIEPKGGATSFGIYNPSAKTSFGRSYTLSSYINNQSSKKSMSN